jgi:hypothetical protein
MIFKCNHKKTANKNGPAAGRGRSGQYGKRLWDDPHSQPDDKKEKDYLCTERIIVKDAPTCACLRGITHGYYHHET